MKPKYDTNGQHLGCPVLTLSRFYLFAKPPHTSYIRLTRTDLARSILQRGYLTLTPPNNHTDLLQPYPPLS